MPPISRTEAMAYDPCRSLDMARHGLQKLKQRGETIRYPAHQCVKLLCQVLTQQGQFSSNTPKLESKYCLPVPPSKPDRSGLGAFPAINFSLRR